MSQEGVCEKCWNINGDKADCALVCKRREAYAMNRSWQHIPPYGQMVTQDEAIKEIIAMKKETTVLAPVKTNGVSDGVKKEKKQVVETEPNEKTWQLKENVCKDIKKCLICGREESDKVKIRRGLCVSICYARWNQGKILHPQFGKWRKITKQELNEARGFVFDECLIDGCHEIGDRRGLCQRCYRKWQRGYIEHPIEKIFKPKRNNKNKVIIEKRKGKEMDFNDIVENRIEQIRTVLTQKAKEYATDTDRWHNFNRAGEILGVSPERALVGMMVKHFVSVLDLVTWGETCPEKLTLELIDEKINDNCNYLILLEGLLKKRLDIVC